jgi:hypothetical protein
MPDLRGGREGERERERERERVGGEGETTVASADLRGGRERRVVGFLDVDIMMSFRVLADYIAR